MNTPFADRLAEAVLSKGSSLVVGLDPDPARFPEAHQGTGVGQDREATAAAILAFNTAVIEEVAPFACAVKPQSAYYEAWGAPGVMAYEATINRAHEAGLLVIGDVKRGDIGSTAKAYAAGHLLAPGSSDAITVNPYLGTDSIDPFVQAARDVGGGLFILVRTSNPSAADIQDLQIETGTVHEHVAGLVNRWGADDVGTHGFSSVGAVVGATRPQELARLREAMPKAWLLVPGVGAQGGRASDIACAYDERGLGAVVNSSRGILYAFGEPSASNWRGAIASAARALRDELAEASGMTGVRQQT
jgi:orotidine-5'-phosphate decarboxylase